MFELDGERHTVRAGDTVYLRRGVAHAYQHFTTSDARLLVATTPGVFSGFFVELSAAAPLGALPTPDRLAAIATNYGMTVLGPPMFQ